MKFLAGLCGSDDDGDGSDKDPPRPLVFPDPIPPSRPGLTHLYFGSNDAQITETDDHVNMLFAAWGGDEELAERIRVAAMPTILDVSDLLFTTGFPRKYVGPFDCVTKVRQRLDALLDSTGRVRNVVALYVIDEPERESDVPASVIDQVLADLRVACESHFETPPALHICYGDGEDYRGSPDWIGVNNYDGDVRGILERLVARLLPGQRVVLYPGGADPWRNDPRALYDLAQQFPQVIALCSFLWVRYEESKGVMRDGIRDNGMAEQYRAIGRAIINAKEQG